MSGGISASTVMAGVAAAGGVGSIGMGILGASQQADAQREAGEIAYNNALARNAALENEARQREAKAKEIQAAAQRQAIEEKRKGTILASRATAVMAASGAGVDTNLVAGLLGQGDLGFETALAEGDSKASDLRYQAELNRYEGRAGLASALRTKGAMETRASNTLTTGIGTSIFKGLSLAEKYAPSSAPGGDPMKFTSTAGTGGLDDESLSRVQLA